MNERLEIARYAHILRRCFAVLCWLGGSICNELGVGCCIVMIRVFSLVMYEAVYTFVQVRWMCRWNDWAVPDVEG